MIAGVEGSVLTTLAELRALHDEWACLWGRCASATPFQHPTWLCEWVEQFHLEAPRVLLLRRHQRLVGLVPMLIYREGARRIVGLLGGGVSDYLDTQRTAYCYLSGFDPEYRRFSPGKLALLYAMEGAIAEGCTVFDCLRGSEPYKRGWGAVERPLQRWHLLPLMAAKSDGIEQEG